MSSPRVNRRAALPPEVWEERARKSRRAIRIVLLLMLILVTMCITASVLVIRALFSSDMEFCTPQDSEYILFTANLDSWIEEFATPPEPRNREGMVEVWIPSLEDDKQLRVWVAYNRVSYLDGKDASPYFYLPIGLGWPTARFDTEGYGYIYFPDGKPPFGWSEPAYEFQGMGGNVFCYRDID